MGGEVTCHEDRAIPLTLQDVERVIQRIEFPLPGETTNTQAGAASIQSKEVAANPVLSFACQFQDPDSLAEGALVKNSQEKLWDSDGLFHVIEKSQKCSATKIDELRGVYCTCSHQ